MENLIILAGWNSKKYYFQEFNKALKDKFNIYYIDFNDENSSEGFKRKLNNLIESENLESFHVLAWSMGSLVLFENYLELKNKIKSIVLIGGISKFIKEDFQSFGWDKRVLKMMIRKLKNNSKLVIDEFNKKSLSLKEREIYSFLEREEINLDALVYGLEYLMNSNFNNLLEKINKKTLIIQGEEDYIVSIKQGEFLNKKIKNSKFLTLKETGHMSFYTNKEGLLKELNNFFDEYAMDY